MKVRLLEELAGLFDPPADGEEYARRFAALLVRRLSLRYCAVALGSHDHLRIAGAAGKNGALALAQTAIAESPEARDLHGGGEALLVDETLFLPLARGGGVEGLVVVRAKRRPFGVGDVARLRACVHLFALGLENAHLNVEIERLAERSTDDPLTGVHNRRGFEGRIHSDFKRAARDGAPIAVALIEVDRYPSSDPERPHPDECLRQVARAISAAGLRSGDYVARFGAHEFAIVMPSADEDGALALCDRIRRFVALRNIERSAAPYGIVTVSAGVAAMPAAQERGSWLLLAGAGANLERAILAGRNRAASANAVRTSPLPTSASRLPPARHAFVGRAAELEALANGGSAWATLTGGPGIGKTAVALEYARRDRGTFVDCYGAGAGDVVGRIGDAVRAANGDGPAIVVLDRCGETLAPVVETSARGAWPDRVRIVATSRVPLGLPGEAVIELGPLSDTDAAHLLLECAHEANPLLAAHLEGIPFAVEIAARALYARTPAAYTALVNDDDGLGRAIRVAAHLAETDLPALERARALATGAHAARLGGHLSTFERLLGALRTAADEAADPGIVRAVGVLECAALATDGIEGEGGVARAATIARELLARYRREDDDLAREATLAGASIAWHAGDSASARRHFERVIRAVRAGATPYILPAAWIEAANFHLAEDRVDDALALLFDVVRHNRRTPVASSLANALDAYVVAAALRDNLEVAARLHAFAYEYRAATGRRRTPFAQSRYDAALVRHGLATAAVPPEPGGIAAAFDLALTL